MRVRRCGGSTIWSLGILLLFAATSTAWGQCGVCDSGGVCDSQVGITGGFVQVCNDGQWTSIAFPFNTGGALVDTFTAVHNSNTGVGDIYIMGGTCGGPNVNNILVTLCGAIQGAPSGVPVDYCFDPVFTSPVDPTWVVLVFNSSFAFDVAFNAATQGLGTLGTVYGNLDGGADPGLWQDLVNFGFDACYCVDLAFTGCVTQPTGACCLPDGSCIQVEAADCAAAGGDYQGDGTDCGSVNCPPPSGPVNDFCANAIPIFDGDTPYSTIGATTDGLAHAACSFDGVTYADIWYTYTATCEGLLTVSTCNQADYDTDMAGYSLPAPCPPTDAELLACNDDGSGCAGFTSEMSFPVMLGGEYLIRVGGWNSDADQGTGVITITCQSTEGTCCVDGDTPEGEACGDDTNGGCNADVPAYGAIACGESVCGTGWAAGGTRDTDWYIFNHAGGPLEATLESEFAGFVFILTGPPADCGNINIAAQAESVDCVPGTAAISLPAGEYVIWVGPQVFDGYPCGSFNDYRVTVFCPPPPGACCLPDATCIDGVTEAECYDMGGTEWFELQSCLGGFIGYMAEECTNAFFDISGTGTLAPNASSSDDSGDVVPIGFTFPFWGNMYNEIGIASNGYLTFGSDLGDFSNDACPSPTDPNDAIFPYWDDWSPNQGGEVYYQTFTDPNRLMVQWDAVQHFGGDCCATFQAILFETGVIEFRYGADLVLVSPTVGVENSDGSDAVCIDPPMANSCWRFTPMYEDPIECVEPTILGTLIIKQGACPAPVNPNSNGVVPMALIGDMNIDVTQVMWDSLYLSRCDGMGEAVAPNFGPPGPGPKYKDLNHPYDGLLGCDGDGCSCNADEYSDGIMDLQLFFRTNDLYEAGILAGDMGDVVTVVLSGLLEDGTPIEAADCIRLVQPGTPPGMVNLRALNAKDAWIDVTPMDDQLDGGGFGEFFRTFPQGTVISLTADPTHNGKELIGWSVGGRPIVKHSTIAVVVVGESQTIEAIYGDGEGAGGLNEPTPPGPPTEDRPPSHETPLIP